VSEVVRTWSAPSPRPAPKWQLRPWPNDTTALLLVFSDHLMVPRPDDLEAAVAQARRVGARTLRTSALLPLAADVALDHGLQKIEAAGGDAVPDLAGGGRGPVAALVPSKQIPAEEDERRGDQQPADDPQDGQSGPSFPLFGGP